MACHVFLTGKKQVGKSTLLKKILKSCKGRPGGFFTVRTNAVMKDTYSVHLLKAGSDCPPCRENLLFICQAANGSPAKAFDRLGWAALNEGRDASLIVMDELGPHEEEAFLFCRAVLQILDGAVPVLGVLQEADSSFLDEIKHHPKVRVLRVTEENRDDPELFDTILRYLFDPCHEL